MEKKLRISEVESGTCSNIVPSRKGEFDILEIAPTSLSG